MAVARTIPGGPCRPMVVVAVLGVLALPASTVAEQDSGEQAEDAEAEAREPKSEEPLTAVEAEQRASGLFEQGRTAFARGEYAAAARGFDQAYATSPHPSALWNAALAWERGGHPIEAANRFAGYLDEAPPDAPDRDTALSRLRALREKLGRLELQAEGLTDLQLDGQPVASTTAYVSPGSHVITARKGSQTVSQSVSVQAGASLNVVLSPSSKVADAEPRGDAKAAGDAEAADNAEAASDAEAAADQATPVAAPPDAHRSVDRETDAGGRGWPPVVFYAGAAMTAALAGVTVWSAVNTANAKQDFDREPNRANLEAGREKQDLTNILFAVTLGAALLTGAAALWLIDWDGESSARADASTLFRVRW